MEETFSFLSITKDHRSRIGYTPIIFRLLCIMKIKAYNKLLRHERSAHTFLFNFNLVLADITIKFNDLVFRLLTACRAAEINNTQNAFSQTGSATMACGIMALIFLYAQMRWKLSGR
jgi:hypothetical protein